jgi:putative heme iron utilization protein
LTSTSSTSSTSGTSNTSDVDAHLSSLEIAGDTASFPAHAELVRTLIAAGRFATLTTLTASMHAGHGFPYGSLVAYSPLTDGSPMVCISELAEHTRNAHADTRAGMLLTGLAVDTDADPLDRPRASLVGRLAPYEPSAAEVAAHVTRHPTTEEYAGFGDFGWWRLAIEAARYVGGFGHMSWVSGIAIAAAEPDPVVADAQGAIDHMNADHADANLDMVRHLARVPGATAARVHAIDRHGITFYATVPAAGALVTARLAFAEAPLDSPGEIRTAVVGLTSAARTIAAGGGDAR